jgi:hypothetical protein
LDTLQNWFDNTSWDFLLFTGCAFVGATVLIGLVVFAIYCFFYDIIVAINNRCSKVTISCILMFVVLVPASICVGLEIGKPLQTVGYTAGISIVLCSLIQLIEWAGS